MIDEEEKEIVEEMNGEDEEGEVAANILRKHKLCDIVSFIMEPDGVADLFLEGDACAESDGVIPLFNQMCDEEGFTVIENNYDGLNVHHDRNINLRGEIFE